MSGDEVSEGKFTVEGVMRETEVLRQLARVLEPFERDAQLRVMECVCIMLGEDGFARMFREARAAGRAVGAR